MNLTEGDVYIRREVSIGAYFEELLQPEYEKVIVGEVAKDFVNVLLADGEHAAFFLGDFEAFYELLDE
jgi:hypothetical protein